MAFWKTDEPERVEHRRPCEVDGSKAWYHGLIQSDQTYLKIGGNLTYAAHVSARKHFKLTGEVPPTGELQIARHTYAMVEYLDGSVAKVDPEKVRFTDV